jgi:hypothetical protein
VKIGREKIVSTKYPLVGFLGEQVLLIGSIELLVTAETFPSQQTIMVKFLLVDRPSTYNAIIGRTSLNELKVVTSTPHEHENPNCKRSRSSER